MPRCGTTNAIFILRQLQEKYLVKKNNLHFAFIDLEKAFVLVLGYCMVGLKETSCRRVVGYYCTVDV